MKFIISRFYTPKNVTLEYWGDECSFLTDSTNYDKGYGIVFEFLVNFLLIQSYSRRVGFVEIGGYAPFRGWIPRELHVPLAKKRDLLTRETWLGFHDTCRINEETSERPYYIEWPCHYDKNSNWLCCGKPDQIGNSIQFTEQAIATLNEQNEMIALWLNPVFKSHIEVIKQFFN